MLKILVTGSNGLLGQKLVYALKKEHPEFKIAALARGENRLYDHEGYTFETVDLTHKKTVEEIIRRYNPDCLIHTAAMTNVDACELDPEECHRQNEVAVKNLLEACSPFL